MKKMIITIALAAIVSSAVPSTAAVNVKQLNQQRRIDAGHRSGKLTNRETRHLKGEQRAISRQEVRMRARHGGHLTAHDKRVIHSEQRKANRHILHAKQNAHRGENHLKL